MNEMTLLINTLVADDKNGVFQRNSKLAGIWREALKPYASQVAHLKVVQKHELVAAKQVVDLNKWIDEHGASHNGACHVFDILTEVSSKRITGDQARKLVMEAVNHPAVITEMKALKRNPLLKSLVGRVKYSIVNDLARRPDQTATKMLEALKASPMFDAAIACTGCK